MNALHRSVEDLVEAIRGAQIERELSDETLEHITGLPKGSVAKYLGPKKVKGLGSISLPLMLGGLGKALVLVDDPEAIERVKGRWTRRNVVGGSAIQLREKASKQGRAPSPSTSPSMTLSEQMRAIRKLVKRENLVKAGKNGAKRRNRTMKKRARQAAATHAIRMRWSRQNAKGD